MSNLTLGHHGPQCHREELKEKCPFVECHVNRLPADKPSQGRQQRSA